MPEDQRLVAVSGEAVAPFVDQPVVIGAELHEVGERGLSTAGPVLDEVGVEEAGLPATGEAAAVVAV